MTGTFFRQNRLPLLHVLFWCVYFSFFFFLVSWPRRGAEVDLGRSFVDAITQVSTMAVISYFHYFYLLPKVLNDRKWIKYLLLLIVGLGLIISFQIYVKMFIYQNTESDRIISFLSSPRFIVQHTFSVLVVVSFVALLRFLKDWFEIENKRKEIENEKLVSELRFLKEQINPHFLFNTLNNLYYLAHTNSPNTKEVIAKLSQMMRYMIYEANSDTVPVAKEIEYLENYIDLERLRLEEKFPILMHIEGEYEHLRISPLIFITFLENAFKHGTTQLGEDGMVSVVFKFKDNHCSYEVTNTKNDKPSGYEKSGIGLKNTKRRLNLSYADHHTLNVKEDNKTYKVKLEIDL
ncbi:MAG: two-component system sensor histidine kinase AlgZ [Algoriphagus sp.]|jgi:two-component system sensor histidine kinase AlgZ